MDHAGLPVGDEQRVGAGVVGEPAERGTRIFHAVETDIGEQADRAGHAVDAPDRAGAAAGRRRSKQTRHEARIRPALLGAHQRAARTRRHDRQPVGRRRRQIDVGRRRAVERDREHLPDLARQHGERLGCGQQLRLRRRARRLQIHDPRGRTVEIDPGLVRHGGGKRQRRLRAGKPGDHGVAVDQDRGRRAALGPCGSAIGRRQGDERAGTEQHGDGGPADRSAQARSDCGPGSPGAWGGDGIGRHGSSPRLKLLSVIGRGGPPRGSARAPGRASRRPWWRR